jgi:hypothetical protein
MIPILRTDGKPMKYAKGHENIGRPQPKGDKSPNWKGGSWTNKLGYTHIYMPEHPNAHCDGYVYKHVLNMTAYLGRPLKKGEVVHHIIPVLKGGTDDISNLQLLENQKAHAHIHFKKTDKSGRFCCHPECKNPTRIYIDSDGFERWYNKGENKWWCNQCYQREWQRNKKLKSNTEGRHET